MVASTARRARPKTSGVASVRRAGSLQGSQARPARADAARPGRSEVRAAGYVAAWPARALSAGLKTRVRAAAAHAAASAALRAARPAAAISPR